MARIPEAELERLKHDVSLEQLATTRGIVLKPAGKNLMGLWPFHDDHAPSLSIDPVQNLWHCFGCQQGGGVIDWVMKAEGVSFRHAVELVRSQGTGDRVLSTHHHTDCEAHAGAETGRATAS
jgi:DNA primase